MVKQIPIGILIGIENSYRNPIGIENGEKNSYRKKYSYRNSYRIGKWL
jgi:hypothetical protein